MAVILHGSHGIGILSFIVPMEYIWNGMEMKNSKGKRKIDGKK